MAARDGVHFGLNPAEPYIARTRPNLHSHRPRPAVSYTLEGEVTYHQEGKPESIVRAGDGIAEGKDTTHWAENRGSVPAVWIAVDVPKEL